MAKSKRRLLGLVLCLASCALWLLPGCSRPPAPVVKSASSTGRVVEEGPWENALELLHKGGDVPSCREALQQVNLHVNGTPEAKDLIQSATPDVALLQKQFGLDPDEVEEVVAPAFRPLDAHHLEFCLLLRDVVEALHLHGLPPLQQAEIGFGWVVRQVTLRGGDESVLPPQFVLRRGQGTAHERALLFLALLQQVEIEGCMIAVPGETPERPRYWIPGILVQEKDRQEIYLFDTRLGLPVPGPEGKGIATLAQVRAHPELLAQLQGDAQHPYDITADQAKQAEVYLACPLSALSGRMKYLEGELAQRDRVKLAVGPARLLKRFAAASNDKVQVWNRPSEASGVRPSTPVRALRLFLPPAEGGVDPGRRQQMLQQQFIPWHFIVGNYRDMTAWEELPAPARHRLRELTALLYTNYILTPQTRLVRGHFEEATRKLSRIESVVRELHFAALDKAAFLKEVAVWRQRVEAAYLSLARKERRAEDKVGALWAEDQYLLNLIEDDQNQPQQGKELKKVLTFLVLGAVEESISSDAHYLLALCWQEKAARLRDEVARRQAAGETVHEVLQEDARSAWNNAEYWAAKAAEHHPVTPEGVSARLQPILGQWRRPWRDDADMGEQLNLCLGLWEEVFRDWRRAITARLFQAEALAASGQDKAALAALQSLSRDVAALRTHAELKAALAECAERAQELLPPWRDILRGQLDYLGRELGPGGGIHWLEATTLQRQGAFKKRG